MSLLLSIACYKISWKVRFCLRCDVYDCCKKQHVRYGDLFIVWSELLCLKSPSKFTRTFSVGIDACYIKTLQTDVQMKCFAVNKHSWMNFSLSQRTRMYLILIASLWAKHHYIKHLELSSTKQLGNTIQLCLLS